MEEYSDLGKYVTHTTNVNSWFLINQDRPSMLSCGKIFRDMGLVDSDKAKTFLNDFIISLGDMDTPTNVINGVKFFIGYFATINLNFITTAIESAFSTLLLIHKQHPQIKPFLIYLNTTYTMGWGVEYE